MSFTVTFFAFDVDGSERVIRRAIIPDETLIAYRSSPEVALSIAQNGGPPRPDGFRITDGRGQVHASFSQFRKA